jgi:hypothetical protein
MDIGINKFGNKHHALIMIKQFLSLRKIQRTWPISTSLPYQHIASLLANMIKSL